MSTTTTNFGLVKPELTDVADITAMNTNWDIIDEALQASANSTVELTPWERGVNIKDLGTGYFYLDTKLEEGDQAAMGLPERYGTEWVGMYVTIRGSEDCYHYEAYIRDWYNDYLWHAILGSEITWMQIYTSVAPPTANDVGALPLSGGTLSGNISINKTFPINKLTNLDNNYSLQLQMAGDKTAGMYNIKDTNNATGIYLTDITESPERAVRLSHKYNGTVNYYNIFGEHNTDLLATTIENLIKNGGISTLQSPIKITSAILKSGSSFSGSGKGKLFVTHEASSYPPTITVDGKSLGTMSYAFGGTTEIEFLSSFNVKSDSNATGNYETGCNAVFY